MTAFETVVVLATAITTFLSGNLAESRVPSPRDRACGDSTRVSWTPRAPRQGALFRVRVTGAPSDAAFTGTAGAEALHFTNAESFAAIPIDASDTLGVIIECRSAGRVDTLQARVPAARAEYPLERLRVAPTFGQPPDSALAARIQMESDRAAAVATQSHETPCLWSKPFRRPRDSRITSGFGRGREFNGTVTSRHMGTDFAGATGAPVRAANRGVVRIVGQFYYGGNVVYVDHGNGLTSAYLHLSRQLVAEGDTVERGQTIGRVGATGRVTGPHSGQPEC